MNKAKLDKLEKELKVIWNQYDFIVGILSTVEYDEEVDKILEYIEMNKGNEIDPSDLSIQVMNICHGEGNWEDGQLIEIVD